MEIEKLQKEFVGTGEVKNMLFLQLYESEKAYIYKVSNENTTHYEVFEKKTVAKCVNFKEKIFSHTDYKEIYPKAVHFGDWAWTFKDFDEAKKCFDEIV